MGYITMGGNKCNFDEISFLFLKMERKEQLKNNTWIIRLVF